MPPIYFLTGAPGAGKSTLAVALLRHFELGIHIPVDDLREWVVSGISHPLPWTDETSRQFVLAENAACDLAIRYQDAGFAVVIDHCHNLGSFEPLVRNRLAGRRVHCVLVDCTLETNLNRNDTRKHKPFEPELLHPTIHDFNSRLRKEAETFAGWLVFDNNSPDVEAAAARLVQLTEGKKGTLSS